MPADTKEIYGWLKVIINEIAHLARGRAFDSFIMRFRTEEEENITRSATILKAAITYCQSEKITILDADITDGAFWTAERQLVVTVKAEAEILKNLTETLKVGNTRLVVFAEGRKPRYFRCEKNAT